MLFHSYIYIFSFLPIALAGFFFWGRARRARAAFAWLAGASLLFYAWWDWRYLTLLVGSILLNFLCGGRLYSARRRKALLVLGVSGNLAVLGWFKYYDFFVENLNFVLSTSWPQQQVVLPLAISFFTFQQITYLVDSSRGATRDYDFVHYALFVCFFPQLIAGPIVHHGEMMPQFDRPEVRRPNMDNIAMGLTLFVFGLAKKVLVADNIGAYADRVFGAAASGDAVGFTVAWSGVLAYSMQIYFDFSGYTDMALGAARMFNIDLPVNFDSPYKSGSVREFWRRWHITLGRFLREYVYIPLGGNRRGDFRTRLHLAAVLVLGGVWHGAAWTFVVWGALHGSAVIVNNLWQGWRERHWPDLPQRGGWPYAAASVLATFLFVSVTWIFFRAESFSSAWTLLSALVDPRWTDWELFLGGLRTLLAAWPLTTPDEALVGIISKNPRSLAPIGVFGPPTGWLWIAGALSICWLLPNSQQIVGFSGSRPRRLVWRPNALWGAVVGLLFFLSLLAFKGIDVEFIYFQF